MSNQTDTLALASALFASITAICALYLSYAALRHSARPNVKVKMLNRTDYCCGETVCFRFRLTNVGHWYVRPPAVNTTVFCNFAPEFELIDLRYGSTQSYLDVDAKIGVGNMMYLKAKGLKLTYGEEGEEIHVRAVTPRREGKYRIRISGFSDNGASISRAFRIRCANPRTGS